MSLRITFLGTAGAMPTVDRGLPSLAIRRDGDTILVDCGEGTQRQMMTFGVSFALSTILLTHYHPDHVLGVEGLLMTMSLQGRREPLAIYGPPGLAEQIYVPTWLQFPVQLQVIEPGDEVVREGHRLRAFPVEHGTTAVGYVVTEDPRPGRFDVERATALGVPDGPLRGRLIRGEEISLGDGRVVRPADVVGSARPGRRVVVSGDTRPCEATIEAARDADILVHEATFVGDEQERAIATHHSTAREAAEVAARAGAHRLLLTHLSARHARAGDVLLAEARAVFAASEVAHDGLEVEISRRQDALYPAVTSQGSSAPARPSHGAGGPAP